jgi:WD40 repeat protein
MPEKRYKAFISYSHGPDSVFAQSLQRGLERFAKPWNAVRAIRVFRDQTNLSVAPALWPEIEKALLASEHLIYLATPKAAQSKWIARELDFWIAHNGTSRLHIVVCSGAIEWDDASGDFNWSETDCLPSVLKGAFRAPPLYLDCTKLREGNTRANKSGFEDLVATLAAALHGKEKDEIYGEHRRQHRKTMRLVWFSSALLWVLALGLALALIRAHDERVRTEHEERIARAQKLAEQSMTLLDAERSPQTALLLAAEALKVTEKAGDPRVPAAEDAIRAALGKVSGIGLGPVADMRNGFIGFSNDSRWLAAKAAPRIVRTWDLRDIYAPPRLLQSDRDFGWLRFAPDSKSLVSLEDRQIRLWSPQAQGAPLVLAAAAPITAVAITTTGSLVVAGLDNGQMEVWTFSGSAPPIHKTHQAHRSKITRATTSLDDRYLLTGSEDRTARIWDLTKPDPWSSPRVLSGHTQPVSLLAISRDGSRVITAGDHNVPRYWSKRDDFARPVELKGIEESIAWMEMSPDGRWLLTGGDWAYASLVDLSSPDPSRSYTVLRSYGGPVGLGVFSDDSKRVLTAAGLASDVSDAVKPEPQARVWDISGAQPKEMVELKGHTDVILDGFFFRGSSYAATSDFDNTIRIWKLSAQNPGQAQFVLRANDGAATRLLASRDNQWLASIDSENTARVWPLTEDSIAAAPIKMCARRPSTLSASGDGSRLFVGGPVFILWNLAQERPSLGGEFFALPQNIRSPAVSVISRRRLAVGFGDENGKIVLLWDLAGGLAGSEPELAETRGLEITGVSLTDDYFLLESGKNGAGQLTIWDLTKKPMRLVSGGLPLGPGSVAAMAVGNNGRVLAVARPGGDVQLFSLTPGAIASGPTARNVGKIASMQFSPKGGWLAARAQQGQNWDLRLWRCNGDSPIEAGQVGAEPHGLEIASFSPDEHWLVTGGFADAIRVWDLRRGRLDGHANTLPVKASVSMSAVFSADGRWLVTSSYEGKTRLWNLAKGMKSVADAIELGGHVRPLVHSVFSRDSRWLFTADSDLEDTELDPAKTCRVWDLSAVNVSTSAALLPKSQLPFGADRLDMSVDGRWLITSSIDGVRLWPVGTQNLLKLAAQTAGRELSTKERRDYLGQ